MKSTNYFNTFIEVAEDSAADRGESPPKEGTVAKLQYKILYTSPYKYTSDDVLFSVHATRNGIPKNKLEEEKEKFFSKGQPCFRSSPLTKRYGWGVHSDSEGKIAIFAVESKEYEKLKKDKNLKHLKGMRSKRI